MRVPVLTKDDCQNFVNVFPLGSVVSLSCFLRNPEISRKASCNFRLLLHGIDKEQHKVNQQRTTLDYFIVLTSLLVTKTPSNSEVTHHPHQDPSHQQRSQWMLQEWPMFLEGKHGSSSCTHVSNEHGVFYPSKFPVIILHLNSFKRNR